MWDCVARITSVQLLWGISRLCHNPKVRTRCELKKTVDISLEIWIRELLERVSESQRAGRSRAEVEAKPLDSTSGGVECAYWAANEGNNTALLQSLLRMPSTKKLACK